MERLLFENLRSFGRLLERRKWRAERLVTLLEFTLPEGQMSAREVDTVVRGRRYGRTAHVAFRVLIAER